MSDDAMLNGGFEEDFVMDDLEEEELLGGESNNDSTNKVGDPNKMITRGQIRQVEKNQVPSELGIDELSQGIMSRSEKLSIEMMNFMILNLPNCTEKVKSDLKELTDSNLAEMKKDFDSIERIVRINRKVLAETEVKRNSLNAAYNAIMRFLNTSNWEQTKVRLQKIAASEETIERDRAA